MIFTLDIIISYIQVDSQQTENSKNTIIFIKKLYYNQKKSQESMEVC